MSRPVDLAFEKGKSMIYTLTPNPAIDYNISCDGLQPNTVTRTRDAVYTPNGKGLNVSFTLDHYGVDTAILGFFAGFSGRYIVEGARELGVDVKPVWTEGITRVNVFLNAGPDTEYNMVNAGAAITAADEDAMFDLIDRLDDLDCLVDLRLAAAERLRGLPAHRHRARPCEGLAIRARHLQPPARGAARARAVAHQAERR